MHYHMLLQADRIVENFLADLTAIQLPFCGPSHLGFVVFFSLFGSRPNYTIHLLLTIFPLEFIIG